VRLRVCVCVYLCVRVHMPACAHSAFALERMCAFADVSERVCVCVRECACVCASAGACVYDRACVRLLVWGSGFV
jgi:hypothetical protein